MSPSISFCSGVLPEYVTSRGTEPSPRAIIQLGVTAFADARDAVLPARDGVARERREPTEACEAGRDHDADPLRFTLPYLGREVNVGFYSRKRAINTESSFSVLG